MLVRPVDANGDMMPIEYSEQLITGGKAVAQVVTQRLLLYFGEWWEDEEAGFRIPQFLADGVRSENLQMLQKYISSYVAGTEGVDSVTSSSIILIGRTMTYRCVIHAKGEGETVEVNLDGILSSEY